MADVIVLAFAMLGLAPMAHAAAPGNDDFANAESLGIGLPVTITRTNVEATKEMDEPLHGFVSAGRSIWFKWEALDTELITIGTCGSEIDTVLAVYTGTVLDDLTEVAANEYSIGPNCPFEGSEVTFRATAGVTYSIVVDGNSYFPPGGSPPDIEGEIDLQIRAPLPPPNDDFGSFGHIHLSEAEAGSNAFFGSAIGSNANASKEIGEPDHAGDPGGASVWYTWTAPISGDARIHGCMGFDALIGVYTGNSLATLVSVPPGGDQCLKTFTASEGTTYRMAVDGRFDALSGFAEAGSFELLVSVRGERLASGGGTASTATVSDITPPRTTVSKRVLKRKPPVMLVSFSSSELGSTFRCKLDKRAYSACRSPKRLKNLSPGRHTFKVVATDAAGNADPTPAKVSFRIPEPSGGAAGAAGRR